MLAALETKTCSSFILIQQRTADKILKMGDEIEEKPLNFHDMGLDHRILKAIALLGWLSPTLIQEKAIPLLLEGKDVLLRARTGSGKTAAFAVPVIQKILTSKSNAVEQSTSTIILAPSRELCQQIKSVVEALTIKCSLVVRCIDLSQNMEQSGQKHLLAERPDIVISTPSKLLANFQNGHLDIKSSLETLIVDEADLIFSFGFENEVNGIVKFLPPIYQAILASATLSDDVLGLRKLILHNPVILKLQEPDLAPMTQMTHYHISAEEQEKATILYSLFKLHLVRGKSIVFVNSVDRCYKLKLFLEQFGIKSCVMNSQLPANIRCHAVMQFNQGKFDIIVASDERALENPSEGKSSKKTNQKPSQKSSKSDKEFDLARGIDFQYVSNVINFDFPRSINSYIHRAGRTARGNNTGSVLSFVNAKEQPLLDATETHLKDGYSTEDDVLKKYEFKLDEIEAFKYRANDAWRTITRVAIKQARLKEIRAEILNSEKLKGFFEENPRDLLVLRHDKPLHTLKVQPHLVDVPDYIVPESLKRVAGIAVTKKRKHDYTKGAKAKANYEAKMNNPLLCAEVDYAKKRRK